MKAFFALWMVLLLAGCATNAPKQDPWMSFNREMHKFNHDVDLALVKPIATLYDKVTPEPVNKGITNFFNNLDDITVVVNDILQLKFSQAGSDSGRFLINSTLGILGFMDPATGMGLVKHQEDFGQTLGAWGVPSGPYLVLPFLGPSSLRDFPGKVVDGMIDIRQYAATNNTEQWIRGTYAVELLDQRADLLEMEKILDSASTDPYAFLRDTYLQQREKLVRDGTDESVTGISDQELFNE